jgi:hypothetical protein
MNLLNVREKKTDSENFVERHTLYISSFTISQFSTRSIYKAYVWILYILYTKSYQHIYKDTKGLALHGLQDMIV